MIKLTKTMVMIIGHERPDYLIDTAESIRYYNKNNNYDIVFAIDFNKEVASVLANKYGKDHVFVTQNQNGWGRGILRTVIHALEYFKSRINYCDVITFDSDALCVGPFINTMVNKADQSDVFFVGAIWHSPSKDHGFHHSLRSTGFMSEYPYKLRTEMAAGPCMMWTSHCLKFLHTIGLMPAADFDKRYNLIHFAHDQLSTWLNSCGAGKIKDVNSIMEIKWRQSLPTFNSPPWGEVPITKKDTAIIHPTKSNRYTEDRCREFFRFKRKNEAPQQPVVPHTEEEWKSHFRKNDSNSVL